MAEKRPVAWAKTITAFKTLANQLDEWSQNIEMYNKTPPGYTELSNIEEFDRLCAEARAWFTALQYESENPILFRKFELEGQGKAIKTSLGAEVKSD